MTLPAFEAKPAAGPIPEPRVVHNVELAIAWILRIGVALSIALVVVGTCLSFYHHPEYFQHAYPLDKANGHGEPLTVSMVGEPYPRTLAQTVKSVRRGQGQGIVVLGLLVLLATPVLSVAAAVVAFAVQKDRAMAIIATVVLLILIVSMFLGRVEGG